MAIKLTERRVTTSKLPVFLIALAEDLELRRAYAKDPESLMAAHGLSEDEKEALRCDNVSAVYRTIGISDDAVLAKLIAAPKRKDDSALRQAA
jgi:hypothetical protein